MDKKYTTATTERLPGEESCVCCKKPVKEWLVTFEESMHTDSGFDKRHRCPHCGAKSFADESESASIFLFFVAFYPTGLLWGFLFAYLNDALQWRLNETVLAVFSLIAAAFTGVYFSESVCRIWKTLRS